ncbi:DUF1127 domain-containing protein [Jannaschia ovalis]|uniref:DUF1127 domain-containing protein n=1 Tax=Jannaschia ovalis TaxID=3038773 RepID=A0ABY8LG85_9RHOB|nr:DUF1127 domain-containing protein [Jannaschia sp. GRR-S6-38]WGH79365.1 DUF1127 domain-containing protein [Jannaschia sp. GRR-S6-38]
MTEIRNALAAALSGKLADWSRRRAVRRDLYRLDERSLEDIGFNRADVDIRFG